MVARRMWISLVVMSMIWTRQMMAVRWPGVVTAYVRPFWYWLVVGGG